MWHIILPIFRWWFESCWFVWVDLDHSLLWIIRLSHCLVTNLSIFSKCMRILIWVVNVSEIIEIIFIFINQRLEHLMWYIILLVLGWWLKTCWAIWIDLSHSLLCMVWLSHCLVTSLGIFSKSVRVLVWIVNISNIVMVIFVLINQRLKHLMWYIILLVLWCWF